ncbi:MAG: ferredoxin family protein [Verrucomicrobiales bacterium]|nr:ferredoxin family protein [Verrucomicrobiales bacterium]
MALTELPLRVVLYEGSGAVPLEPEERLAAISTLLEHGFGVTRLTGDRPTGRDADPRPLLVGRWQQGTTSAPAGSRRAELTDEALAEQVESARAETAAAAPGAWKPWFPVIDYDRCTNCMQCLSFCLFGVYGVDEARRIQVQNQDRCKTNCPACSRVCPEAAIMFPKYASGPINGAAVNDADLDREKMKIDISALLGGDIYSLLRARSERARSRFSQERDADKALAERQKCLKQLAALTEGIPPEVLMSLPSPEEIARRAEEAAARARTARVPEDRA